MQVEYSESVGKLKDELVHHFLGSDSPVSADARLSCWELVGLLTISDPTSEGDWLVGARITRPVRTSSFKVFLVHVFTSIFASISSRILVGIGHLKILLICVLHKRNKN